MVRGTWVKGISVVTVTTCVMLISVVFAAQMLIDVVEKVVEEEIARLPELFPKIIGTPQYWGVSQLPKKNDFTGKLGGSTLRIAFNCKEEDREMLTYQVYEELVGTVKRVNEEPEKKDGV